MQDFAEKFICLDVLLEQGIVYFRVLLFKSAILLKLREDALVKEIEDIVLFLNVLFDIGIVLLFSELLPILHLGQGFLPVHRLFHPLNKVKELSHQQVTHDLR